MDEDTSLLIHALFRAHRSAIHAGFSARGAGDIGSPQLLLVIRELSEKYGRPPFQKELAERMRLSPATIATSLKSLENKGYVRRQVDPEDARRNQIAVTQRAREALDAVLGVFRKVDEEMLTGFSGEEIAAINAFHRRMLENLYRTGAEECPGPPRGKNCKECDSQW